LYENKMRRCFQQQVNRNDSHQLLLCRPAIANSEARYLNMLQEADCPKL
jgi:hypothetical protein